MVLPTIHSDEEFVEKMVMASQKFKSRREIARLYRLLFMSSKECYSTEGERPSEYSRFVLVEEVCEYLGAYYQTVMNWSYILPPSLIKRINIIHGKRRKMAFHLGYPERFDKVVLEEAESLLAGVKDG